MSPTSRRPKAARQSCNLLRERETGIQGVAGLEHLRRSSWSASGPEGYPGRRAPIELPVMQPTKFDLVINLKTAKTHIGRRKKGATVVPDVLFQPHTSVWT